MRVLSVVLLVTSVVGLSRDARACSCEPFTGPAIDRVDHAVEGEVVAVERGFVTVEVKRWLKGGSGETSISVRSDPLVCGETFPLCASVTLYLFKASGGYGTTWCQRNEIRPANRAGACFRAAVEERDKALLACVRSFEREMLEARVGRLTLEFPRRRDDGARARVVGLGPPVTNAVLSIDAESENSERGRRLRSWKGTLQTCLTKALEREPTTEGDVPARRLTVDGDKVTELELPNTGDAPRPPGPRRRRK